MGLVRFIAAAFSPSPNNSRSSDAGAAHLALGRRGEKMAARFLRRAGFKILYRNYRPRGGGEVDLVCRDKRAGELVFIEVKTRSSTDFGRPAEAVNAAKRELITRGALSWLRLLERYDVVFRFDIVEIVVRENAQPEINHLRDAFQLPGHIRW